MPTLVPAIDPGTPVLNAREACEHLGGIAMATLGNYTHKGVKGRKLATRRVGGRVYFHPDDLKTFTAGDERADLSKGKMSEATLRGLRAHGFKV